MSLSFRQIATLLESADERGLFTPASATVRVARSKAALLSGACVLLEEAALPPIAKALVRAGGFTKDPMKRFLGTLNALLTLSFGTRQEVEGLYQRLKHIHARVPGAEALENSLWVYATLVDTSIRVHEMFVRELDNAGWEAYYQQSVHAVPVFGIPRSAMPGNLDAFRDYMHAMLTGPKLVVTDEARMLAQAFLFQNPPLRWGDLPGTTELPESWFQKPIPSLITSAYQSLSVGMLPQPLREKYGFHWTAQDERFYKLTAMAARQGYILLPDRWRAWPQAREHERRWQE